MLAYSYPPPINARSLSQAVRFDAAADRLVRTAGLLNYNIAYTVMVWFRVATLPTGGAYNTIFAIDQDNSFASNYDGFVVRDASGVTRLCLYRDTGSYNEQTDFSYSVAANTWLLLVLAGTASALTSSVYSEAGALISTLTATQAVGARTAPTRLEFGGWGSNDLDTFNGRAAHPKIWQATLSADDIRREMWRIDPVRKAGLYGYWPTMRKVKRGLDYSGLRRHLTEAGTLTDEAGPPGLIWGVLWRRAPLLVPAPAGGGHIVSVGQVTETDLTQALTHRKALAIGQVAETDLAQTLARLKQRAVGQVTEAEIAQAITAHKTRALGQITETNLPQAVTARKALAIGQPTETEAAQSLTTRKARAVAQVTETDLAQTITAIGAKTISVEQVTETEIAQAITRLKTHTVSQVAGTELAQSVTRQKVHAIEQINETDSAQNVARVKAQVVDQVTETDLTQTLTHHKTLPLGQVNEADAAQTITTAGNKIIPVGQIIEADSAQAITRKKVRPLERAVESETAHVMQSQKARVFGLASEIDIAQLIVVVIAVETTTPENFGLIHRGIYKAVKRRRGRYG